MEKSIIYSNNFEAFNDFNNFKKVLNIIEHGNIMEDGPTIETPHNCKIQLKLHQKRIIYEMLEKEADKYRISRKSNLFVISDKVGSGKSMNVLGLIAHKPRVDSCVENIIKYKPVNNYEFTGYDISKNSTFLRTNLIVVPHSIFYQWVEYIKLFPSLTYYCIQTQNNIKTLLLSDVINGKYDIILVKSTKYNKFMENIYDTYKLETDIIYKDINDKISGELDDKFEDIQTHLNKITDGIYKKNELIKYNDEIKKMINKLDKIKDINTNELFYFWKESIIDKVLKVEGPIFDRVFFDEANSISIPNCKIAYGKYNWYITSSLYDLIFPKGVPYKMKGIPDNIAGIHNHGFIRNSFSYNHGIHNYQFLQDMYLKNNDEFIKNSFNLEEPIKNYIECFTPVHVKLLNNVALPNIIDALNANDISTALNLVNCNIKTDKDISRLILSTFSDEIKLLEENIITKNEDLNNVNDKIKIEKDSFKKEKMILDNFLIGKILSEEPDEIINIDGYVVDDNMLIDINIKYHELKNNYVIQKKILDTQKSKKYNIKNSITKTNEKLVEVKYKHDSLKDRITDISNKNCPICLEIANKPTIVPCCKHIYCFECLMYCLNTNGLCALCRTNCKFNDCIVINNDLIKKDETNEQENKLLTKIEKIIELLGECKTNPNKRFLIFSSYENSLEEIIESLNKNDIKFNILKGSTGRIRNIIDDYKNNKTNVLLLNAKFFGSGLNLEMTSDIIIYHRMDKELEKQIIGRGQRLGRTGALKIHYLCHDNEIINQ